MMMMRRVTVTQPCFTRCHLVGSVAMSKCPHQEQRVRHKFPCGEPKTGQGEETDLQNFIDCFLRTFHDLAQFDDSSLRSVVTEGPYLSELPQGLLEVLSHALSLAVDQPESHLRRVNDILRVLTVLSRNPDNIAMVTSSEFVAQTVSLTSHLLQSEYPSKPQDTTITSALTLLECLHDPYLVWRRHPHTHFDVTLKAKYDHAALLHPEIIPFIHETVQHSSTQHSTHSNILNLFGAIVSGSQKNALLCITPATLDMVLSLISRDISHDVIIDPSGDTMTNQIISVDTNNDKQTVYVKPDCDESTSSSVDGRIFPDVKWERHRHLSGSGDMICDSDAKDVALRCFVVMVQRLHLGASEKRQVDLNQVISSYVRVLGDWLDGSHDASHDSWIVSMIYAVNDMVNCQSNSHLQLLFSEAGMFKILLNTLLKLKRDKETETEMTSERLVVAILHVCNSLLSHCVINKAIFKDEVGFRDLCDILKSLGQPSKKILEKLLDMMTEDKFTTSSRLRLTNPELFASLLSWLPTIESHDTLVWLCGCLLQLCRHSNHNCMVACRSKVVSSVLELLKDCGGFPSSVTDNLLTILETLGAVSMSTEDVKQLISIIKTSPPTTQGNAVVCKLLQAMSAMIQNHSPLSPLCYIDIQHSSEGLYFHNEIKRLPGSGFTFHCWLRLDTDTPLNNHRRQLYCLRTEGRVGFEAFFTSGYELVVAVFNKKDYSYAVTINTDFTDNKWHMVDIAHTCARRPLSHSQVLVYVDGVERTRANMKYPSTSQPITTCHIGNPGKHVSPDSDLLSDIDTPQNSAETSPSKRARARSMISDLLHTTKIRNMKRVSMPAMSPTNKVEMNPQISLDLSGPCISLIGQISSVHVLSDVLYPPQITELYARGASGSLWSRDGELSDLPNKTVLHINASACTNGMFTDLSGSGGEGIVEGVVFNDFDVKSSINCVGGIQILLPLLEVTTAPSCLEPATPPSETSPLSEYDSLAEWEVVPIQTYEKGITKHNQIAQCLVLLRHLLNQSESNRQLFTHMNYAATIGALLQKSEPSIIDISVLTSLQLLIEDSSSYNLDILRALYQYCLFDLRIWSRTEYTVQIGHLTYLSSIVIMDKQYFRLKFGVQYILDVIIMFYRSSEVSGLPENETQQIRASLLRLLLHYLDKDVTQKEMAAIVNFVVAVTEEKLLCEVMDILLSLCERARKSDQMYQLVSQGGTVALIYTHLISQRYTPLLKDKILKLILLIVRSERVSDKNKHFCRLQIPGFSGLASLLVGAEVSMAMLNSLLNIALSSDNDQGVVSAFSILQLVPHLTLDIKLEASRQILSLLVNRPSACTVIAKQPAWQQTLTDILILQAKYTRKSSAITGYAKSDAKQKKSVISQDSATGCLSQQTIHEVDNVNSNPSNDNNMVNSDDFDKLNDIDDDNIDSDSDDVQDTKNSTNNEFHDDVTTTETASCSILKPRPANDLCLKSDTFVTDMSLSFDDSLDLLLSSNAQTPVTPIYQTTFEYLGLSSTELTNTRRESSHEKSDSKSDKMPRTSVSSASLSSYSSPESFDVGSTENFIAAEMFEDVMKKALDSLRLLNIYRDVSSEACEELCQNIIVILLLMMNGGVEGSVAQVWQERGEVFSCLNQLSVGYELIRPVSEIQRRLLEMMLHSTTTDLRNSAGQSSNNHVDHAVMMVRVVHDFILQCVKGGNMVHITEWLLEEIASLLEELDIWSAQGSSQWTDIVHLGLNILLEVSKVSDLQLCSVASVKLHTVLQNRSLASSAESCYLIGSLNDVIIKAIQDGTENYQNLILVMRTLLLKSHLLLNFDDILPNLPPVAEAHTFDQAFSEYAKTQEWQDFIDHTARPQIGDFQDVNLDPSYMNQFWTDCNTCMMCNESIKQKSIAESLIKFQKLIQLPFKLRGEKEGKRFENVVTQYHNQHISVSQAWRETRGFLCGERGVWGGDVGSSEADHWMMGEHEMFSRMRVKLRPNLTFDLHTEASNLRDNGFVGNDLLDGEDLQSPPLDKMIRRTNVGDDRIEDEDWNLISAAMSSKEPRTPEKDKESWVFSEDCELVTIIKVTKGHLEVTTKCIYFFDCSTDNETGTEDFRMQISDLQEIHFRRYRLRRTALELFLTDRSNYFLNFAPKVRNKVYSRILSLKPPRLIYYGTRSPKELLRSSGLTEKWVQRRISNFEYLMQLNTIAGRTYNDLSQYPVFPWILCDYESPTLDLSNPFVYRDLSKPIGVQTERRQVEVKEKYEEFSDPGGQFAQFHYGTHYSHPAGVLYYLLRLEPYTTLHIDLFDNKFDHADRQFRSIKCLWDSVISNPVDVKELIPEFFFLPEFLTNHNNFDLGQLQFSKGCVGDVVLPAWARSPEEFISIHRKALESEYVSANLHNWIDLIFGHKQQGEAAELALNVFPFYTYEGAVDIDEENDANTHFGQTPTQLLTDPHPRRYSSGYIAGKAKTSSFVAALEQQIPFSPFYVQVMCDGDPIVYVEVPPDQQHSILNPDTPDSMITVSQSGILGIHNWLPYDKSFSNYFTLDIDPSLTHSKNKKRINGPFHRNLSISTNLFATSNDARLLFCGGHWDGSLQVFSLVKHDKLSHLVFHTDVVTCLSVDAFNLHLITGSRDTTCAVWRIESEKGRSVALNSKPFQILYGHSDEISAVVISSELDLAVSASKDKTVIIHTVRKGQYVRTLRPECPSLCTSVSLPKLCLSKMGHIVIYSQALEENSQTTLHNVHVYNINGKHLCVEKQKDAIGHMTVTDDYIVSGSENGSLTVSSIIGLKTVASLPLKIPILSLSVTKGNSHILVSIADGKLIIVGVKKQPQLK